MRILFPVVTERTRPWTGESVFASPPSRFRHQQWWLEDADFFFEEVDLRRYILLIQTLLERETKLKEDACSDESKGVKAASPARPDSN